jgi:hypothetical protein
LIFYSSSIFGFSNDDVSDFLQNLSKDLLVIGRTTEFDTFNSSDVIDLVSRLNEACKHTLLTTTNTTLAEELSKLSGRLLLSSIIAGPNSLNACKLQTLHANNDMISNADSTINYTGRLFLCLPGITCCKNEVEALSYWKAPRSELVHSFFQLSQVLPMGLMIDDRIYQSTRRILTAGLERGDLYSQHPTGWPSITANASSFIITPVIMWQFASSYFFAGSKIEARFKNEMHKRIDYISPRVNIIAKGALSETIRDKLPVFLSPDDIRLEGKLRLLVISTHWSPGHSSYRITASVVRALAANRLLNNSMSQIAVSLLYATTQLLDTSDTFSRDGFVEAHLYSIPDDDVIGAEALSLKIKEAKFDAIFYPSLGMSGADVIVSSHRLAPLQLVSYGHSASSFSPMIDVFVTGFESEILGPISSNIYKASVDCSPVLDALVEFSKLDEEITIHPSNISPLCETSLPPHIPFSTSLRKRLQSAKNRFSESLLLVPGLGISFTPTFPAIANTFRTIAPLSHISIVTLIKSATLMQSLASGVQERKSLTNNTKNIKYKHLSGLDSSFFRGTRCAPIKIALVWSLVKWNLNHLNRLFEILLRAKDLWKHSILNCKQETGKMLNENKQICTLLLQAIKECTSITSSSTTSSTIDSLDTNLYIHLTAFTAIDTDGGLLKRLAVETLISRRVHEKFKDDTVSFKLISNASQPITYLGALSQSDVAIDSSPFAACNAMQDFVSLAIPIAGIGTVLDFDHNDVDEINSSSNIRWRSTIGASMLTKLGLTGLVALSEEAFLEKSSHLIFNPFLRLVWKRRMSTSDGNLLVQGAEIISNEIASLIITSQNN